MRVWHLTCRGLLYSRCVSVSMCVVFLLLLLVVVVWVWVLFCCCAYEVHTYTQTNHTTRVPTSSPPPPPNPQRIVRCEFEVPAYLSPELQDLLKWCLQKDPTKRPSVSDVQHHAWFQRNIPPGALDMNQTLINDERYNKGSPACTQTLNEVRSIIREAQRETGMLSPTISMQEAEMYLGNDAVCGGGGYGVGVCICCVPCKGCVCVCLSHTAWTCYTQYPTLHSLTSPTCPTLHSLTSPTCPTLHSFTSHTPYTPPFINSPHSMSHSH